MKPTPEFIKELQAIVGEAPYPKHMSMKWTTMDVGLATIELELGTVHLQLFGLVRDGVIATMTDTATFWAVFMGVPEDAGLVNVDLELNYLRSNTEGRLRAEGRSIRECRPICYSEAQFYDDLGSLIAHGTSTLMVLPGKGLPGKNREFLPTQFLEPLILSHTETRYNYSRTPMKLFRLYLVVALASLAIYTFSVGNNHGWDLLPIFFSDIAEMSWSGQFNVDFMTFLGLSGIWVAWRHQFSGLGLFLGLIAFFGGMLFLGSYLLYLSFQSGGNIREMAFGRNFSDR